MNDTLKTIYERRAVRKYKDKAVTKSMLDEIINAGKMNREGLNLESIRKQYS